MMNETKLTLPANCAVLTGDDTSSISGGSGIGYVIGGIFATGVSVALAYVGAVAARGVLGILKGVGDTAVKGSASLFDKAADAVGSLF